MWINADRKNNLYDKHRQTVKMSLIFLEFQAIRIRLARPRIAAGASRPTDGTGKNASSALALTIAVNRGAAF